MLLVKKPKVPLLQHRASSSKQGTVPHQMSERLLLGTSKRRNMLCRQVPGQAAGRAAPEPREGETSVSTPRIHMGEAPASHSQFTTSSTVLEADVSVTPCLHERLWTIAEHGNSPHFLAKACHRAKKINDLLSN